MHALVSIALGSLAGLLVWGGIRRVYPVDPWWVISGVMLLFGLGDLLAGWRNDRANERGEIELHNGICGSHAVVQSEFTPQAGSYQGRVRVAGESWRARSSQPLVTGDKVRVIAREGLLLQVQPLGTCSA